MNPIMEREICWWIPRLQLGDRGGAPRGAGANAARLSPAAVVFCRGTKTWRTPSDGPALRRAGTGLWRAGGPRRPTATGQGADDHAGSESLVGISGVR